MHASVTVIDVKSLALCGTTLYNTHSFLYSSPADATRGLAFRRSRRRPFGQEQSQCRLTDIGLFVQRDVIPSSRLSDLL